VALLCSRSDLCPIKGTALNGPFKGTALNGPIKGTALNGPFVVLDVRGRNEYDQGHIMEAVHYDSARICRERFESEEIRSARDGRLIIVYGDRGMAGRRVADTLHQRLFNVRLLSGGIEAGTDNYSGLMETASVIDQETHRLEDLTRQLKRHLQPAITKRNFIAPTLASANRSQTRTQRESARLRSYKWR